MTMLRGSAATLVALATFLVAGQSLVGLDECYSRLEVDPHIPGCCDHDEAPSVEDVHRSCCRSPFVAELASSSTTASTPDVGTAELAVSAAPVASWRESLSADPRGFRPAIERPPDRSPPTTNTVLLI